MACEGTRPVRTSSGFESRGSFGETECRSAACPPNDQPHRRRRGGRAAGERGQGAGRERARRRRRRDRGQADGGGLPASWWPTTAAAWRADELPLAVERHATSKLAPARTCCASPRSASAARPCRRSARSRGCRSPAAPARGGRRHAICVEGGAGEAVPAGFPGPHGARVEVRDLFYATPARLKFMKSERSEIPGHRRGAEAPGHGARGGGLRPRPRRRRACACPPRPRAPRAASRASAPSWAASSRTMRC